MSDRNATTEEYTWDLPEEWRVQDEYDFYEGEVTTAARIRTRCR